MKYTTPEKSGIAAENVLNFYRRLEEYRLSVHSVIFERGERIFSESYYAPFTAESKHRMYSVSKTFVGVAVLFCVQDGLLSLDEPIARFFPDFPSERTAETVRELLEMETSAEERVWWFGTGCTDRTEVCFRSAPEKLPGTLFAYDTAGSFLLGVIVEKLTGKPFLSYLQEKLLNDIGFSADAFCLTVPGGHSFGDSGVMCTPRDILLFARFLLNRGCFGGRRYLREDMVKQMTDCRVCTNDYGFADSGSFGYGWQVWGAPHDGFALFGMGGQLAVCLPREDLIFVITGDNQGNPQYRDQIYAALFGCVVDRLHDGALPENPTVLTKLRNYEKTCRLFCLPGSVQNPFASQIDGRVFVCRDNPMRIKWFRLTFSGWVGNLEYENMQGKKAFSFGFGHNEFGYFPETGYADQIATVPVEGHRYRAAFSADWPEQKKLRIRVQIIDQYFGNLAMVFGFRDRDRVSVRMSKTAEAFLDGYQGILTAEVND